VRVINYIIRPRGPRGASRLGVPSHFGSYGAVALCCAYTTSSLAQGTPQTSAPIDRQVYLTAQGDAAVIASFEASFGELLRRMRVQVTSPQHGRARPIALIDVQLGPSNCIEVRSADARNLHIRRCVTSGGPVAANVETLAHIGYDAVEEIAQTAPAEPVATELAATEPIAAAVATTIPSAIPIRKPLPIAKVPTLGDTSRRWGVDMATFAQTQLNGTPQLATGAVGLLGGYAITRSEHRVELWVSGAYQFPATVTSEFVDLKLQAGAIRVWPALRLFGGRTWFIEVGPVVGVDLRVTSTTSRAVPAERLITPSAQLTWLVGASAAWHIRIREGTELLVGGGLEADGIPQRYLVRVAKDTAAIFEFSRLRPTAFVALSINLAGQTQYPEVQP
jgi:hypothetical protein